MRVFKVKNFTKVNTSHYIEGDVFLTKQKVAILHNGKIETLVKQSDVRSIIREELKKVKKNDQ